MGEGETGTVESKDRSLEVRPSPYFSYYYKGPTLESLCPELFIEE